MSFDNETPSPVNTSYDLAHTINFDSELMSMLDEFDVLSKAMKIETDAKGDDYEMLHNSSLLSENNETGFDEYRTYIFGRPNFPTELQSQL